MKSKLLLLLAALPLSGLTFNPVARAQTAATVTILHNFGSSAGSTDGAHPFAGLIQGTDGNFYGVTQLGGSGGNGVVFEMTSAGALTTLHAFGAEDSNHINADGAGPNAPLFQANDGNFYGAASGGGAGANGTIFEIASADGKFTTVYSFNSVNPGNNVNIGGAFPDGGLNQGSDGLLYGTAIIGGEHGNGTVFKLTTAGVLTTLHDFSAYNAALENNDGGNPSANLALGNDGLFYSTAANFGQNVAGTIYQVGSDGAFSTVHDFVTTDGQNPQAGVILASDGNFYGTSLYGGKNGSGCVFKSTSAGAVSVLYSFTAPDSTTNLNSDGAYPQAGLIQGKDGNLYGVASGGGAHGQGTVFQLTLAGTLTTLHSFGDVVAGSTTDGASPYGRLLEGTNGNIYGVTYEGGAHGLGTIFQLNFAPAVTSAVTATAKVGQTFSYQITATNNPTSYQVSGLRDGLSLNSTTGVISGTPTTAGTVRLTLSATNADGTGAGVSLTITVAGPPVVTSATTAGATVGTAFAYQITATGNPTSYSVSGLRDGLSLNASTGKITGTPTTAGTVRLGLTATNSSGTSATVTLTITVAGAPVITSAPMASAQVGKAFFYQITATGSPTSYSATGLRDGLTLNTATGVVSGIPGTAGTVRLTLNATNSIGTGSRTLAITVAAN